MVFLSNYKTNTAVTMVFNWEREINRRNSKR